MPGLTKYLQAMGDRVRPGQRIADALTAERLNAIMASIRAIARGDNVIAGRGLRKATVSDGVLLTNSGIGSRVTAGAAETCPFDITIATDELLGLYATFRAGTINQLLPDNYLSGVVVPDTGTKYLVLNCTASNGQITGATFTADDDPPDAIEPFAGQPPTTFAILIGVVIDGEAVKVWGCGNIQALGIESFRLQKVTPVAGGLPYDVYYTWQLSLL